MREMTQSEWTVCGCDVCGAATNEGVVLGEYSRLVAQRQNDYLWHHKDVQCGRCGFAFNALRPSSEFLRDYYADCWPIASTTVEIQPDFSVPIRLELLRRWFEPGARLYEIGDKLGEFCSALTTAGFVALGDDVMAIAAERARWLEGLFQRDRETMPPVELREAFDGVLAYFVMEHLANPRSWLTAMRGCLKDRGLLVVEVPHFARHPKEALMHEHFLYLTPESLGALLREAGFETVEVLDNGASRAFGFTVVARKASRLERASAGAIPAAVMRASYQRGRELLVAEENNLSHAARMAAEAAFGHSPAQVSFFGANQTARDIAAHLRKLADGMSVKMAVYDNSDAKEGMMLAGFMHPVQKPRAHLFSRGTFHVGVICSRGWTREIAEQICSFRLPGMQLIDGSAARVLTCSDESRIASNDYPYDSDPTVP